MEYAIRSTILGTIVINPDLPADITNLLYIVAIIASIVALIKSMIDKKIDDMVITVIACCFILFIIKNPEILSGWGKNITDFIEHIGGEIIVKK